MRSQIESNGVWVVISAYPSTAVKLGMTLDKTSTIVKMIEKAIAISIMANRGCPLIRSRIETVYRVLIT
jgi:hypothetical protein